MDEDILDLESEIIDLWKKEMPHYPIEETVRHGNEILLRFTTHDASGLISTGEVETIIKKETQKIANKTQASRVYFLRGDVFSVVFMF